MQSMTTRWTVPLNCCLHIPNLPNQTLVIAPRQIAIDEASPEHLMALGTLRHFAEASRSQWPQYKGLCAKWVLGRMRREWSSKGGVKVSGGELVLVEPKTKLGAYLNQWECSVYSPRSEFGLGMSVFDVELL